MVIIIYYFHTIINNDTNQLISQYFTAVCNS